jgi:Acetyltransferase (GNAT) domain
VIQMRCCHTLAEAEPWHDAINGLNLVSARPDPFSTFEYYGNFIGNALQFAHGQELRLWLLLAFDGERLVGHLALKHSTQRVLGMRASKLDLLTAHVADRPHLVCSRGLEKAIGAALYDYLLSRKGEWSLLEFQQQEADSALLPAPATWDCRPHEWPNQANGTVPVRWASTAGYVADLSKRMRSNVNRQMRSLLAAGDVHLLSSSDPQSLHALFELYRSIETHSWKARAVVDIGHDPRAVAYITGLMDPAQPMRLTIQVLLLDGVPIAGLICGAFHRGLHALHIVYDERLSRLSPGSAILLMGMRLAIERGYEFFNLLWGFGYYKSRWLAQMSETRSVQVFRVGTPWYWRRALGDLLRWVRPSPAGAPAQFNPSRHEVEPQSPAQQRSPPGPLASPEERERYGALVARVHDGAFEFLSSRQLAASVSLPAARRRQP